MILFSSTNLKNKRETLHCWPTWRGRLPCTSFSVLPPKYLMMWPNFFGSWMKINYLSPCVSCPVGLCFSNPNETQTWLTLKVYSTATNWDNKPVCCSLVEKFIWKLAPVSNFWKLHHVFTLLCCRQHIFFWLFVELTGCFLPWFKLIRLFPWMLTESCGVPQGVGFGPLLFKQPINPPSQTTIITQVWLFLPSYCALTTFVDLTFYFTLLKLGCSCFYFVP